MKRTPGGSGAIYAAPTTGLWSQEASCVGYQPGLQCLSGPCSSRGLEGAPRCPAGSCLPSSFRQRLGSLQGE